MRTLNPQFSPRLIVFVLLVSCLSVCGQAGSGTGVIGCSGIGVAPVKRVYVLEDPTAPHTSGTPANSAYSYAFFWSEPLAGNTNWTQLGSAPNFLDAAAGQFAGGTRTINGLSSNGAVVDVKVRAWERAFGSSYEAAVASGLGHAGESVIVTLKTKDPVNSLETVPSLTSQPQWTGFGLYRYFFSPRIEGEPENQTRFVGTTATFAVSATGTNELSYQWQFNGTNLAGETTAVLTITNLQFAHAGVYRVIVTEEDRTIVSRSATLTVILRALHVAVEGSGSVTKSPDKEHYELDEQVTLAASPARWHTLERWGDGLTDNPRVITIGETNQYSAIFTATTALEVVTINGVSRTGPIGMPAVLVDGQFITEAAVTNFGRAQIEIRTTFPDGLLFRTLDGSKPDILSSPFYAGPFQLHRSALLRSVAYTGDFSTSVEGDPIEITIIPTYRLGASTPGGGQVDVEPALTEYLSNSVVTLSAIADEGWRFLGWLGDVSDTNAAVQMTIKRDQCVQAVFATALATTISGSGTVSINPDVEWYPFGTEVRIFAAPDAGHSFVLWSNAGVNTNNPLQLLMTATSPTVGAAFQALSSGEFALAVDSDGLGKVIVSPRANRYVNGQSVTIAAMPASFQTFLGWSGDATGTQNPMTLSMTRSRIITAHFTRRPTLAMDTCDGPRHAESLRFRLIGELGASYGIESSVDLRIWTPTIMLTNVLGVAEWSVDTSAGAAFFRSTSEP